MQGSVPTPYIMDDRCDWYDAAHAIKHFYDIGKDERNRCGVLGHEFVTGDDSMMSVRWMCKNFIDHMDKGFENFEPRKKINTYKV